MNGEVLDRRSISPAYRLGPWTFFPDAHELVCDGKTVSLEHRTARAFELLCQRRGEIVSQDDLLQHVWAGRQVSSNSIPVVMRDLRQALGDDARNPKYLQTVAKRGYRLLAPEEAAPFAMAGSKRYLIAAAVFAAIAVIGAVAYRGVERPAQTTLVVSDSMPNMTGNKAMDSLAQASNNVVVTALSQAGEYRLTRSTDAPRAGGPTIRLMSKLVLWSGQPDVVLTAVDSRTSDIVWSGYAFGPEGTLPQKLSVVLQDFRRALAKRNGVRAN